MHKLIAGTFFVFLSATLCAQSPGSENQGSRILVASGAVYWAHCDKRCEELKCPDTKACYNACVENKGTIPMCPRAPEKAK